MKHSIFHFVYLSPLFDILTVIILKPLPANSDIWITGEFIFLSVEYKEI